MPRNFRTAMPVCFSPIIFPPSKCRMRFAEMNHLFELDGKNPWEVLMDKLELPYSTTAMDVSAVACLAAEIAVEPCKDYDNRFHIVGGFFPEPDGSLFAVRSIPAGTKLWLARGNEKKVFEGVDRMMARIQERLDGRKPLAVFHADCAGRGKLLLNRIMKEEIIHRLQYPICRGEDIPWLGIYGGGEFNQLDGKNELLLYSSSLYVLVHKK